MQAEAIAAMSAPDIRDAQAAPDAERDAPPAAAAAVQRCFERCADAFCRYFTVRAGGADRADDLMQQLWLRARLAARDLRTDNPEPWLWRIAQNLLREAGRRRGRDALAGAVADPRLAAQIAAQMDEADLPDELLTRREARDQLLLALTSLPAELQELIIAFYFDGRSQADLARLHKMSERAVEGRLYRARLALRDRLAHLIA